VEGPSSSSVGDMDLCQRLVPERSRWRPIPPGWSTLDLDEYRTLGDVAAAIAAFDDESDRVLAELLAARWQDDELVVSTILAGLQPLVRRYRANRPDLMNDLLIEATIVVCEMRRVRPTSFGRRTGYVIVDRAHDRQRHRLERAGRLRPRELDPNLASRSIICVETPMEEFVEYRLLVRDLRDRVEATGERALIRSWNTLLDLDGSSRDSQSDRDRWKYVRRRLIKRLRSDAA